MKVSVPMPLPPPLESPAEANANANPPATGWPAWHTGMDKLLYALLLLTAVLAGMFVARNSDIWRNLAVGRLLVQGKYTPGSDPLSFTGAGRAWVNPNLLYEPFSYALYSLDRSGAAIVAVKAFAFAGVFLLLFRLRQNTKVPLTPNPSPAGGEGNPPSLWPWCVCVGLGILACAPQATLRPQVYGLLFFASALLLLYRSNWAASKWRTPLLYAMLVFVWGMFDVSAFLGPLLVLLLALGETILPSKANTNELASPASTALWRTLPLALAGWLLNPSFLLAVLKSPGDALAQLIPSELYFGFRSLVSDDTEFVQMLSLSAFAPDFTKSEKLGQNVNGLAAIVLMISSGIVIAIRFRLSQLFLWLGLAYLPVAHYRWIPFFAILAVPITASLLAGLGASLRSATHDDQRRKILLLSAGIGRIFSLVAVLAMLLATIPGWLHPKTNDDPAFIRRVDWGLESDVGARRGAEMIAQWRSRGELPAEVNLLLAFPDYGDYSVWFTPQEKVFTDTRYQFHRAELPDLVAIREVLLIPKAEKELTHSKLLGFAEKYKAGGIVICRGNRPIDNGVVFRAVLGFGFAQTLSEVFARLWTVDGRFAVVGRDDVEPYTGITQRLSFDAIKAAFGPQTSEVPIGSARKSEEIVEGIVARFLERPQAVPAETDDAGIYRDRAALETQDADGPWLLACTAGSGALGGGFAALANSQLNPNRRTPSDAELAYELLALRAARTGAAKNPDSPFAYRTLAAAYQLRYIGLATLRDSTLVPLTALVRTTNRYPPVDRPRDRFTRYAILDGLQLFLLQLKMQQYDAALQTMQTVLARMENAQPSDLPNPQFFLDFGRSFMQTTGIRLQSPLAPGEKQDAIAGKGPDWLKKKFEEVRDETKKVFAQKNEIFTSRLKSAQPSNQDFFEAGKLTMAEQFLFACELGLLQKALDLVPDNLAEVAPTEIAVRLKNLNPQFLQNLVSRYRYLLTPYTINRPPFDVDLRLQTVSFMLQLGKVEQAAETLQGLDIWLDEQEKKHPDDKNNTYWRDAMAGLKAELAWIVGDFPRSEEYLRQRIREHRKVDPKELRLGLAMLSNRSPLASEASGGLLGSVGMLELAVSVNRSLAVVQGLRAEAQDSYELGLNALHAGKISQAQDAFRQTLKPQGVPLESLGVSPNDAEYFLARRYLQLIEQAAGKSP